LAIFDLDGVVLDSVPAKQAAFRSIFGSHPRLGEIDAYNSANLGIPRRIKLAYVLEHFLEKPASDGAVNALERLYREEIARTSGDVAPAPGVHALLHSKRPFDCCVNSSAPREDVVNALTDHGLIEAFVEVHGYPETKAEVLHGLRAASPGRPLIFFGDAQADLDAAQQARVPFVAVGRGSVRGALLQIDDFRDLDLITELVLRRATSAAGQEEAPQAE
jgi:phosphoglycolate phosphatase-like HAD superfamily hydrolase